MMTTAQELKLLLIAEKLRITVEMDTQGVLNDDDLGGWFPQHKLILLRPGLSQADLLHTLAHELGHAIHNHIGEHHPRQERKADEFAAQILISKDDYIRAEEMAGGHIPWVAHELGVTVDLVKIWRSLMERKMNHENSTYRHFRYGDNVTDCCASVVKSDVDYAN